MHIVSPSRKSRTRTVMVRVKAVVFTAIAAVWGLVSFGAASSDLPPQFHSWHAMRIIIWVVQFLLLGAVVCFCLLERQRPMKVEGLPEPTVIHSSWAILDPTISRRSQPGGDLR